MLDEGVVTSIVVIVIGLLLGLTIWASHGERMKELELKPCIEQVEQK